LKVKITNFQSIASAELDLKGFTVIVGRSNLGKSALFRSIKAAFLGWSGNHFVRQGNNHCGVSIEDDDFKLIWRKVIKESPGHMTALQINADQYTKLGQGGHPELTKKLGVWELDISAAVRLTPQFASQHDSIFLINLSDTIIAEVFKQMGRADVITDAQAMAKKELKEKTDLKEVRTGDKATAVQELQNLLHVPSLRSSFDDTMQKVRKHQADSEATQQLIAKIKTLQAKAANPVPDDTLPQHLGIPKEAQLLPKIRLLQSLKLRHVPDDISLEAPSHFKEIETIRRIKAIGQELATLQLTLDQNQETTSSLEKAKVAMEEELGVCPTCNRQFEDHLCGT